VASTRARDIGGRLSLFILSSGFFSFPAGKEKITRFAYFYKAFQYQESPARLDKNLKKSWQI